MGFDMTVFLVDCYERYGNESLFTTVYSTRELAETKIKIMEDNDKFAGVLYNYVIREKKVFES